MWRVGSLAPRAIVEATSQANSIKRVTEEGEYIPLDQIDIDVGFDKGLDTVFPGCLPSPSPTRSTRPAHSFGIQQQDLETDDKIVVILEGMVEATAMTPQAHILPGQRDPVGPPLLSLSSLRRRTSTRSTTHIPQGV